LNERGWIALAEIPSQVTLSSGIRFTQLNWEGIRMHRKNEYFWEDEPIEFLLLASTLAGATIVAAAVMVIMAFL